MNEIKIRPIVQSDNSCMRNIIVKVMTEFECNGPGFSIHDSEVESMSDFYKSEDRAGYFVVEVNGDILGGSGIALLKGADSKICELKKMYVLPQGRGMKIGKMLMDECEKLALKFNFEGIYLETTLQMKSAQNLYVKSGFIEIPKPMGNTGHYSCDKFFYKNLAN